MNMESFVIAAFRYDQKNSVLYKTANTEAEIAEFARRALFNCKADVVSIRRVYEVIQKPLEPTLEKKWVDAEKGK
jgi:tRNA U34 5-carboxymethylaminomethyl modifying GTPase MnmE/TrmE